MSNTISNLAIKISADSKDLEANMVRAGQRVKEFGRTTREAADQTVSTWERLNQTFGRKSGLHEAVEGLRLGGNLAGLGGLAMILSESGKQMQEFAASTHDAGKNAADLFDQFGRGVPVMGTIYGAVRDLADGVRDVAAAGLRSGGFDSLASSFESNKAAIDAATKGAAVSTAINEAVALSRQQLELAGATKARREELEIIIAKQKALEKIDELSRSIASAEGYLGKDNTRSAQNSLGLLREQAEKAAGMASEALRHRRAVDMESMQSKMEADAAANAERIAKIVGDSDHSTMQEHIRARARMLELSGDKTGAARMNARGDYEEGRNRILRERDAQIEAISAAVQKNPQNIMERARAEITKLAIQPAIKKVMDDAKARLNDLTGVYDATIQSIHPPMQRVPSIEFAPHVISGIERWGYGGMESGNGAVDELRKANTRLDRIEKNTKSGGLQIK